VLRQQAVQAPTAESPTDGLAVDPASLHRVVVMGQQRRLERRVVAGRQQGGAAVVVEAGVEQSTRLEPGGEQAQGLCKRHHVQEGVGRDDIGPLLRPMVLEVAGDEAKQGRRVAGGTDLAGFERGFPALCPQLSQGIVAGDLEQQRIAIERHHRQRYLEPCLQQAPQGGAGPGAHVDAADRGQSPQRLHEGRAHLAIEAALVQVELGFEVLAEGDGHGDALWPASARHAAAPEASAGGGP